MEKSAARDFAVAWVSVPEANLAAKLARGLVEAKLAACVTEIPKTRSHYVWEGKLEAAEEIMLMIKTRLGLMPALERYVKEHHSARVPEIICVPVAEGSRDYLEWIGANTLNP